MTWTKQLITKELRKLYRAGTDLSYNALSRKRQSLVSAAAYHFGSYRRAIDKAGIDYTEFRRRPRWDKPSIIRLIKQAKRRGEDLHWSAVTKRRDELGRAAFASLQPRLFKTWARALHAAGLDADEESVYRSWDPQTVLFELRERYSNDEALNSGALQQDDPGLHAAAIRLFKSYDDALRAARLNPEKLRERRRWTKPAVLQAIRQESRRGTHLSDSSIRRTNTALYGAAVRLFGSFSSARDAAKVKWKRASPKV